jgi:putative colanic acid biosynthesis acetyltransferase WcaF
MIRKTVNNAAYIPTIQVGAGKFKQLLWYFINVIFFRNSLNPSSGLKIFLLKLFGASIGKGVVIKPAVNIKYPWKLMIGSNSWIGENVWIDNLEPVSIGNNCCLSQGCLLLTGSHDAMKENFDYTAAGINLQDGVWIGANAIVSPGVTCKSHSILGAGAVTDKDLDAYTIYKGNPAVPILKRTIH